MVPETLTALADAAGRCLKEAGLDVAEARLACLRARELSFPLAASIDVRNGTTHQLYLGVDHELATRLNQSNNKGFSVLCENFLESLLKRLPTRRPIGELHWQTGGPGLAATRGVRSYVVRFKTASGALFVLGDLISRLEYETVRESEFEAQLGDAHLPANIRIAAEIPGRSAVDNLLVYLRKLECDLQIEVTAADGARQLHNGLLWGRGELEGRKGLLILMDLPLPDETPLQPGATVTIHTGVRGRHLSCTSRYLGRQTRAVGAAAVADCLVFTAPAEFRGDQRRKAFRIPIQSRIVAEVQPLPQPDGAEPQDERPGVLVQLLDLSFTGARLGAPEGQLREAFQVGEAVHCRLVFPGLERVAEVRALVRRCDTVPADRNERQDVLGVEFQINGTSCRRTLEFVRDFVLAEQRALLARRVEILGSA